MKKPIRYLLSIVLHAAFLAGFDYDAAGKSQNPASARERLSVDSNWKFSLSAPVDSANPDYDDRDWREITLPHDWSIEGDFDRSHPMGPGGGYLPAGIGWYRRSFDAPDSWRGKHVSVEFEGVYMRAEVWLNGVRIDEQPYGYVSFVLDLSPHLKFGQRNLLAVRVDNSQQPNSRWYSGSGIYRHVWLTIADPVHVAPWGVFVQTPAVSPEAAQTKIETRIMNKHAEAKAISLRTILFAPDGRRLGEATSEHAAAAGKELVAHQEIAVANPPIWSQQTPHLSRSVTQVSVGGRVVDEVETTFGFRTLAWSAERGFLLNGERVIFVGGCVHHDNGALGAAAFDRAEVRRVELLKAAGFNAIRASHNPPSPAFLDACDRLGMLVMDEAFDCWERGKTPFDYSKDFSGWWERDLDAFVRRDRNHPSVVMWSVGNELWEQYTERGMELGIKLAERIRSLDTSRPVTQAFFNRPQKDDESLETWDKLCAALDVVGYNYRINERLQQDYPRVAGRIMVVSESQPNEIFDVWKAVQKHPFVLGDFLWTAMDYLGENGIGRWQFGEPPATNHANDKLWPWHGAPCGDLDIMGVRKDRSFYRNILWDRGEKLYLTVQQPCPPGQTVWVNRWGLYPTFRKWNWPGFENQTVKVEVYSRYDSVRLYQDGNFIGEKLTGEGERFTATFDVSYRPGTLKVVGLQNGQPMQEDVLTSAGPAARLRLTPDRATFQADGQDLSFVAVEVVDEQGRLQMDGEHELEFSLEGPGVIAGVANSDLQSLERHVAVQRKTFEGRAQIIVRSIAQSGALKLTARAKTLSDGMITLSTTPTSASTPALP